MNSGFRWNAGQKPLQVKPQKQHPEASEHVPNCVSVEKEILRFAPDPFQIELRKDLGDHHEDQRHPIMPVLSKALFFEAGDEIQGRQWNHVQQDGMLDSDVHDVKDHEKCKVRTEHEPEMGEQAARVFSGHAPPVEGDHKTGHQVHPDEIKELAQVIVGGVVGEGEESHQKHDPSEIGQGFFTGSLKALQNDCADDQKAEIRPRIGRFVDDGATGGFAPIHVRRLIRLLGFVPGATGLNGELAFGVCIE